MSASTGDEKQEKQVKSKRLPRRLKKSLSVMLCPKEGDSPEGAPDGRVFEIRPPSTDNNGGFRSIGTEGLGYTELDVNRLSGFSALRPGSKERLVSPGYRKSVPPVLPLEPKYTTERSRRPRSYMGPGSRTSLQAIDELVPNRRRSLALGEVPPSFRAVPSGVM